MNLKCIGCGADFESLIFVGYCAECKAKFAEKREHVHAKQRPAEGVFADGKFAEGSPQTVFDPVAQKQVCGLCGSAEVESGYGLGSGFGIGVYMFCNDCFAFLDFVEDKE